MEPKPRLSMNTTLKNANIFDDDAWEEIDGREYNKEKDGLLLKKIKTEKEENDLNNTCNTTLEEGELRDSFCSLTTSKTEVKIKIERDATPSPPPPPSITIKPKIKIERDTTPPPPPSITLKPDPEGIPGDEFNESPYNKELFANFKIKEETPIKSENIDEPSNSKIKLKSAKRTVFTRHSPYKRVNGLSTTEEKISAKSRLGPKIDEVKSPRKRTQEKYETDPAVIARREKQISYGKNTIGYDNYIQIVPRDKRTLEDPKTPNKLIKYSRRAWDGLIKQWRLKLHKYDPPSDIAES